MGLVGLEGRCQSFKADVEDLCERQEVSQDLVVSKKDTQRTAPGDCQSKIYEELKELEEQRAKEASALVQKQHKLIEWDGERERGRSIRRLEVTRTISPLSGHACSSSLAPNTDEAMSASSRMSQEMEEKSEASWTALAKEKNKETGGASPWKGGAGCNMSLDTGRRRLNGSRRRDEPLVRWQKGCN